MVRTYYKCDFKFEDKGMKRTCFKEIYRDVSRFDGKEVTVCGWVRTLRDSKAFGFIELNDGSFFKNC